MVCRVLSIISSMDDRTRGEQMAWDMYFCTLVGFQFHPANAKAWESIDLETFADIVDQMMVIRAVHSRGGE